MNYLLLCLILLQGCSESLEYKTTGGFYETDLDAAVSFYKSNYKLIKSLTNKQEGMGYVVKCDKGFKYTNLVVGGLLNSVHFKVDMNKGCSINSFMHTHPIPPQGKTADFFSHQDLHLGKTLPVYMFSLESNRLRVTKDDNNEYGTLLGTINLGE